ncbi:MAG: MaoC/PaaZ C-terminal domain-containing protein [Hyphomonas sp.]
MLYSLGLGLGSDPLDERELPFVYEKDQKAMPTIAAILVRGLGVTVDALGIDYRMSVHGEQSIIWHNPMPPHGRLRGEGRVLSVYDKGDKGAVVNTETDLIDAETNIPLATVRVTSFARGDGNCGAPRDGAPPPHPMPDRAPDLVTTITTRPDQALLYRLSGDYNPLHADPGVALSAGFDRPILHGLCTYGLAARIILDAFGHFKPETLKELHVRFSAPVLPGDTITFHLWKSGTEISFTAHVRERDATVLKNGRAVLVD